MSYLNSLNQGPYFDLDTNIFLDPTTNMTEEK